MSASRFRSALPVTLLFIVVAVVFGRVLGASFLAWDDNLNVTKNDFYHPVTLANTLHFWVSTYNKTYRPLVHTAWAGVAYLSTFSGEHAVPGAANSPFDARVFHAFNLALHLVNVGLVWLLARRWTRSEWAAAGGTLLFALHPVQVESVAWVTGFNEVLCGTFCLLSTIAYCRYAEDGQGAGKSLAWAAVAYLLALLVKPAAVALPLVLGVLDVLIAGRPARAVVRTLSPWVGIGALFAVVTQLAHPESYAGVAPPFWQRPFVAGDALTFYLSKLVWPYPLGIDYGRKPSVVLLQPRVWFAWILPALLVGAAWWYRKRSPWPLAALLCGFAWLLPVLGFTPFHFQLTYSTVADRYLYFALVVGSVALARGLDDAALPARAGFGLVAATWAVLSWMQCGTWRDNFTVFAQAIKVNPASWMAEANLASAYHSQGQRDEAKAHVEAALAINPDLWEMHVMLARYAHDAGDEAEARRHWREVLRLEPIKSGRKDAEVSEREARSALGLP